MGRTRVGAQPVERPEERRERLARAGGRRQQDVLAGRDRRPGLVLGGRGGGEGLLEPLADPWSEAGNRQPFEATASVQPIRSCRGDLSTSWSFCSPAGWR